jgi:hypothetical protein
MRAAGVQGKQGRQDDKLKLVSYYVVRLIACILCIVALAIPRAQGALRQPQILH